LVAIERLLLGFGIAMSIELDAMHDPQASHPWAVAAASSRILIVEDELFVAMDIESVVLKAGHRTVGFAGTADRAVELTDQLRPDLVLMDIRLRGERDGIDAAIEIRERFDIPSLIISAHTDAWARQRAAPARVLGFISKPFDRALLEIALNGGLKP
jgi:two-component system, response regulator PdtaR